MRRTSAIALCVSLVATASCYHSTQLAATWHEPNPQPIDFKKMVTVFVAKDQAMRRSVEDKLASEFANAVPSYRVLSATPDSADRTEILQRFRREGFDGAIIMRVTNVSLETTYVPGTYWYDSPYTFGGYWQLAWAYPYDPGYIAADQVVTVETEIYSLTHDKLIFAARSETTNPQSAGHLTNSVIRHVMEQLRKDRLVVTDASPAEPRAATARVSGS